MAKNTNNIYYPSTIESKSITGNFQSPIISNAQIPQNLFKPEPYFSQRENIDSQAAKNLSHTLKYQVSKSTEQNPISKLTIYSKSGHIVQKYLQQTRAIILPKSVEISTIIAIDHDGKIIPFTYIPETTVEMALTNRFTGEKVNASIIKGDRTINGKVISKDADNITLITNNQITNIRDYDQLTVDIDEDFTRPRLSIENFVFDDIEKMKYWTLSYLISDISWTCIGTALIDNNNNIMYLRLAGNITNNTECDIDAETTLVSGEIYQNRKKSSRQRTFTPQALMATNDTPTEVYTSMLEDYTKYFIGNKIIHNQDIAELGATSVPIIKFYVHKTSEKNIVKFGYRFIASEHIPSCSINVYSINNGQGAYNEIDSYLGSNEINEAQKSDEVDIILGESTMLQCDSNIIVSNDFIVSDEATAQQFNLPPDAFNKNQNNQNNQNWHIITEDLTVKITNHNTKLSSLILKHYVGDKFIVETKCQPYKKRENGFIEWYLQIPPKISLEKNAFFCQIVTAAYY